jgi:tetratricopeptide (TPR) repeat protein
MGRRLTLAASTAFVVAVFSKEQGIVLPALLAVSDLAGAMGPEGRTGWREVPREIWRRYRWYLLILAAYLTLRIIVLRMPLLGGAQDITFLNNPLAHVTWDIRLRTAIKVAGAYLWLFLWPARLSVDYSYDAIPLATSIWEPPVLLAVLAWGALLALGVYGYVRRVRSLTFGVGCTVLMFLPVSNLVVPIGTMMAERLFYLPSAGLCLVVGAGWDRLGAWVARGGHTRLAGTMVRIVLVAVLVLLSARTVTRNQDWRSTEAIFRSAARVVPGSAKVHAVEGHFLLEKGRPDQAIEALREALRIDPSYETAYLNLGVAYARTERWREAEASLEEGLAIAERVLGREHPLVAEALDTLGQLYVIRDRAAEADPLFRRALAILEQTLGRDHQALAEPLEHYSVLLRRTGRTAEAAVMEARARAIRGPEPATIRP